ncbi:SprT-like domain-containing protein [Pedobacter gandavensis]|uniref:SprT-like domain-containing protein n=1 Tax=Pedobacter gandavensis TaxID=2679963 RepID=UPI0024788E4B|nr:SprT-like domain-containing protein [Pedobacter gandavensis]WGQ12031.1 SprT-like domain-containing protein [Pedobacter gandavensis]
MKKNKTKGWTTLLLFLNLLLFGCKKEIISPNTTNKISINEAKSYFQDHVVPNSRLTAETLRSYKGLTAGDLILNNNVNDLLYKEPLWNKATYKGVNNGTAVAIPIKFRLKSFLRVGENETVNFDELNYLLITKKDNNELTADWVTLYPDIEWLRGQREKYIGRIKIADWDGNLKKTYSYHKNGEVYTSDFSNGDLSRNQTSSTNWTQKKQTVLDKKVPNLMALGDDNIGRMYKDNDGNCWINVREIPTVDQNGHPGVLLQRKQIDCSDLFPELNDPIGTNPGSTIGHPGSSGTGPGSSGNYTPEPCNPNSNSNGSSPTSGPSGPAPCLPPVILIDDLEEIKNEIKDPCLNTTITEALNDNKDVKGFMADLLNRYSGKNNGIIINIKDMDVGKPAQTKATIYPEKNQFEADITLNSDYFKDSSKEFVVSSLIHEMVHAYLLETNSTYRDQPKEQQHNFMFSNFAKDIAGYLTSKYNMPSNDAWSLAWSGMGDVFQNAADDERFETNPGETLSKSEITNAYLPYNSTGDPSSKGIPNCPNQ